MGLGKAERQRQRMGVSGAPESRRVQTRIAELRLYRWSSARTTGDAEISRIDSRAKNEINNRQVVLDAGKTGGSAGCQPAVSPTGSRQGFASSSASVPLNASQAASPSIPQTASLRYDWGVVPAE
jgi:hypothetical protein